MPISSSSRPIAMRLIGGRAIVRVSPAATRAYFIDTPAASVSLDARGEYTVSAVNRAGNNLEVSVARGSAEIDDGSQRVVVRAGEAVSLACRGRAGDFQNVQLGALGQFRAVVQRARERFHRLAIGRTVAG